MSLPILKASLFLQWGFFIYPCLGLKFAKQCAMKKHYGKALLTILISVFISKLSAQLGVQLISEDRPVHSHQYTFLNNDRYFFIDTTFNSLHWYHQFNHRGRDNFNYAVLGSMGTPMNHLTFSEAGDVWNDYFSLGAYEPYFTKQKSIPFYYVRSPLTEANFWNGYERGQSFNIYHTQNINENWNAMINYRRLNDLGFYTHNRNQKSRFLANTSYVNDKIGYQLHTYVLTEKMLTEENGGLVNDTALALDAQRVLLNVNLETDSRLAKRTEFYVDQNYSILKLFQKKKNDPELDTALMPIDTGVVAEQSQVKDVPDANMMTDNESQSRFAVGHSFKLTKTFNTYTGQASSGYYVNYFYDDQGDYNDSSGYRSYANTFYLLTEIGQTARFDLKVGLKSLVTHYGGPVYQFSTSNWGFTGNIGGRIADKVNIRGGVDYILTGSLKESFQAQASAKVQIVKWLRLFGNYSLSSKYPEFFENTYFSNNYIWENNFSKQLINELSYGIGWGQNNKLEFTNFIANDFIYFNENVQPTQSSEAVNVFRAELVQNFTIWNFIHQDNRIYYQVVGGNSAILPLPEIVSRNSLYFEFYLFDKVLKCLWGAEMKYFTAYNSPSYDPATARFYVANERSIGDFPMIDAFLNFQIKKARIFLKYEHVDEGLFGYDYFGAPNYPLPDRVIRLGITWRFFN